MQSSRHYIMSFHLPNMDTIKAWLPPSQGRVARATPEHTAELKEQDAASLLQVWGKAPPGALQRRIEECQAEWDTEATLELNASIAAGFGLLMTALGHPLWLLFSAIVLAFLAQHATQGWCPPLPLFRALGYRTPEEIHDEITALRLLHGDSTHSCQATSSRPLLPWQLASLRWAQWLA